MKVNDEFYKLADTRINEMIEAFENELDRFKLLADTIIEENNFGLISQIAINSLNTDIYSFMSGKLRELTVDMVEKADNYITTINSDDKMF